MVRVTRAQPVEPTTGRPLGPVRVIPAAPPPPPPDPPMDLSGYPDGAGIDAVLAWVAYDPARARAAIAAEYDRPDGLRHQLLHELQPRAQEA